MKFSKIRATAQGRRFYTVDHENLYGDEPWSCGYIEINKKWPKDYCDKFYEQFNFWFGATYAGVIFPHVKRDDGNPVTLTSLEEPNIKSMVSLLKTEYQDSTMELIKGQDYFWVVGFDDNHYKKIGKPAVGALTEQIAEQMDELEDDRL